MQATDDRSPLSYQSRVVEIKTNSQNITTPLRAATLSEIIQKRNVPLDVPTANPIGFNLQRLNYIDTRAFLTKSPAFNSLYEQLLRNSRTLAHSPIQICLIQPTLSPMRRKEYIKKRNGTVEVKVKKKPAAVNILEKAKLRQKFLRQLITLQDLLGFDPVTIPYLRLSLSDYKVTIDQIKTALERKDKEPIFFLDMADPNFAELVRYITTNKGFRLIGLFYRKYRKAVQEYELLYNFRKKDVLFMMVETDRFDPNLLDVSSMHMMPFFANDVMAVEFPTPPIIDENDPDQVERFEQRQAMPIDNRIRGLNTVELSVKGIGSLMARKDELLAEIGKPNDSALRQMLDNYIEATGNADNFKALNSFFRVHETTASSKEFTNLQSFIASGSGKDYVDQKNALSGALGRLRDGTLDRFRTQ